MPEIPMLTPLEALRFIAFWLAVCALATLGVLLFLAIEGAVL